MGVSRDSDCIFCKIVTGQIPAAVVHRDDSVLAFLDIGPLAEGHLLVIPKQHYGQLIDMPPQDCATIAAALPKLARAMLAVTGATAFNLLQNNGREAGQAVGHVHFHLIPRKADDGMGYRWKAGSYPDGRAVEIAEAYKAVLTHAAE